MRMSRRESLRALAGFSAVSALSVSAVAAPQKYGVITVNSHRAHQQLTGENLKVYLDGVEVKDVYEADDVNGYALVFCRDEKDHKDWAAKGHLHVKTDNFACQMRLTGNITIAPEVSR